jgi:hypothetical protein
MYVLIHCFPNINIFQSILCHRRYNLPLSLCVSPIKLKFPPRRHLLGCGRMAFLSYRIIRSICHSNGPEMEYLTRRYPNACVTKYATYAGEMKNIDRERNGNGKHGRAHTDTGCRRYTGRKLNLFCYLCDKHPV